MITSRRQSSLLQPHRHPISKMYTKKGAAKGGSQESHAESEDRRMDVRSILKDIEFLGSSHMTWKEKKDLENKKVVSLGGKPPKRQRLPLSVARFAMKKQQAREKKMLEERAILGKFGGLYGSSTKKVVQKRKQEDTVLKATEGHFRNGILDVKHLLKAAPRDNNSKGSAFAFHKGNKKGGKKKSGKKGGGGGRRRH